MTYIEKEIGGRKLLVVDPKTYPYAVSTFDEREPITERWEQFGEGCTVVDVGASFGAYTLSALARGARVVALEPSTDGWRILRENVSQNFAFGSWRLLRTIAWDGSTPFPTELADTVLTKDYPTKLGTTGMATLDEVLECEPRVDCIKCDVEGAELGVLLGAAATLRRCKPVVLLEDHQEAADDHPICNYCRRVESKARITELLESLGYRLQWLPMEPRRMYVIAEAA